MPGLTNYTMTYTFEQGVLSPVLHPTTVGLASSISQGVKAKSVNPSALSCLSNTISILEGHCHANTWSGEFAGVVAAWAKQHPSEIYVSRQIMNYLSQANTQYKWGLSSDFFALITDTFLKEVNPYISLSGLESMCAVDFENALKGYASLLLDLAAELSGSSPAAAPPLSNCGDRYAITLGVAALGGSIWGAAGFLTGVGIAAGSVFTGGALLLVAGLAGAIYLASGPCAL